MIADVGQEMYKISLRYSALEGRKKAPKGTQEPTSSHYDERQNADFSQHKLPLSECM